MITRAVWSRLSPRTGRLAMRAQRPTEEPSCFPEIAQSRDQYVGVLIEPNNGAVDVPPLAGDLDVGLVDEPTVTDRVPAWPAASAKSGVKRCTHR